MLYNSCMRHIHECEGAHFEVDYFLEEKVPTICSVRVLGRDYKPTGPNLMEMFNKMVFMLKPDEGAWMMSEIATELVPSQ